MNEMVLPLIGITNKETIDHLLSFISSSLKGSNQTSQSFFNLEKRLYFSLDGDD